MVVIDHLIQIRRIKHLETIQNASTVLKVFQINYQESFRMVALIFLFSSLNCFIHLLELIEFTNATIKTTKNHWNNYKILLKLNYFVMQSTHSKMKLMSVFVVVWIFVPVFVIGTFNKLKLRSIIIGSGSGGGDDDDDDDGGSNKQQFSVFITSAIISSHQRNEYKNSFFLISSHGTYKHTTLKLFIKIVTA